MAHWKRVFGATSAALATLGAAGGAEAQPIGAPGGGASYRYFVNVNGGYQYASERFVDESTFRRYGEDGTIVAAYDLDRAGALFDVSGGVLVWRRLGVAIGYSQGSGDVSAEVTGAAPHPLFVDRSRRFAPAPLTLPYTTRMAHFMLVFRLPINERWELTLTGGPSRIQLDQDVLRNVREDVLTAVPERVGALPQGDAVAVTITTAAEKFSQSKVGFNGGIDLSYLIHRNVGVGVFGRFAGGSFDLPLGVDGAAAEVDVGGPQAGAGVRLRF